MKSSDRARISYISSFISSTQQNIRTMDTRSFMHPRVYTCLHARDLLLSHACTGIVDAHTMNAHTIDAPIHDGA